MRSRSQQSVLTFLAQDAEGHAFCYANADLRKGDEAEDPHLRPREREKWPPSS